MAVITSSSPAGLTSNRYSQVFTKKLLQHIVEKVCLNEYGSKFQLPMQAGSSTIRMFKRSTAAASDVQTLTEGTPISSFSNSTLTPVDVTLLQYGDAVKITDTRQKTDLINQLKIEVERMGESAALHVDEVIRDEVVAENITQAGTYAGIKRYAGGAATFAALQALSQANGKLTVDDLRKGAMQLEKYRAPRFSGGHYVAVVTPEQAHDLMADTKWLDLNYRNMGGKPIYKGEIGEIFGIKVVLNTTGFVEDGTGAEGTYDNTAAAADTIYTAILMGQESYGCLELAGSASPMKPQFIYNDKPDKADPLNQFVVAGWKGWFAAKLIEPRWAITIRSKSTF